MQRASSESGAILIHVAVGLIGLFLFLGFVVDYGTFWVARNQAQNAADAGALAGATARVYDDTTSPPASTTSGVVHDSVISASQLNSIWGVVPPANTVTMDWNCPDGTTNCVEVYVYRDGTTNSTALPTFFMSLIGLNSQGTKAHAVAEAVAANETGCMRPWFVPNLDAATGLPYSSSDYGAVVQFHQNGLTSGYGQLNVNPSDQGSGGGKPIEEAIEGCAQGSYYIGEVINTKPGGTNGPEKHGMDTLISWDPNATVTVTPGGGYTVSNSCANTNSCSCPGSPMGGNLCPNGTGISPRVAVVALCDPTDPNCSAGGQSTNPITITNLLTFFIDSYQSSSPVSIFATLVGSAGNSFSGGGSVPTGQTFLYSIQLIR